MTDVDKNVDVSRGYDTFALVGELVMISSGLDHMLNLIIMAMLDLEDGFTLALVATIDHSRKLEIIKANARRMPKFMQKDIMALCRDTDTVFVRRNIACHTPPAFQDGTISLQPIAAAKIIKNIDLDKMTIERYDLEKFRGAITTAERILIDAGVLIYKFRHINGKIQE